MRSIRVTALMPIVLMPLTLIPVTASTAGSVNTRLDCPRRVEVGEAARLDLHLENQLCSALSVRVVSTVVGNGDETAGGVAILGPAVA
ncbi:MAG: hypothetical protein VCE43_12125, partial [Myxococcota bacterium]